MIHLFHLYHVKAPPAPSGAGMLRETSIGYSVCGQRLPRAELTAFIEDTECPVCIERAKPTENGNAHRTTT